ncbi:MAG: hypothetical protein HFJ50_00215 [Clostridia bacterium]|jgi:hypothetical protein|nr:hypothetical protein [Clostridia bacterium]
MKKEEFKTITVEGKKYKLGFPTRKSVKKAEELGLNLLEVGKVATLQDKLFFTGLYSYQEWITEDEAERIEEKFIEDTTEDKQTLDEITGFLTTQYMGFINLQAIQKATK